MFLHPEIRLARVELMDLLCFKLNIPGCRSSYRLLGRLQWEFGQKYTNSDGQVFWSTDSQYRYSSSGHRRDCLVLHGSVDTQIRLADGQVVERQTALCCQAICFIKLTGMEIVQHFALPKDIKKEISNDSLTLALVRWFEAHPSATDRDCHNFPMCPYPFDVNHALWRFAVTSSVRAILIDTKSNQPTEVFHDQRYLFGRTETEQNHRLRQESHAYYGLVKTSSIKQTVFMSPEFEYEKLTPSNNWLHTVSF